MINETGDKERGLLITVVDCHLLPMEMAELLLHVNLEHKGIILATTEGPGAQKQMSRADWVELDQLVNSFPPKMELDKKVFEITAAPKFDDVTILKDNRHSNYGYKPHPFRANDRKNFERNNKHKHRRK